jgi:Ala-tRNA(Pro) deacylase
MPATKIKEFLDNHGVKYVSIRHSPAYTAPEVAASSHVAGRDFAKTIVVKMEDHFVMVVLPASRRLVLSDLRELLQTQLLRLATEAEFRDLFPDCEVGAMPPFGNLYGLPVYVAASLAEEEEIAFNAGTHTEVIKMDFEDFAELVKPVVLDFITT